MAAVELERSRFIQDIFWRQNQEDLMVNCMWVVRERTSKMAS